MEVACPNCKAVFKVGDQYHYKMIKCPKCETPFQVLAGDTFQVAKDYIDDMIGGKKRKKKRKK